MSIREERGLEMLSLLLLLIIGLFLVRSSILLRTWFHDELNSIGLQVGDHIYTPLSLIHYPQGNYFDFVLLGHHQHQLHGYQILQRNYFNIRLHYVPVGHKLTYLDEGREKEIPYLRGTPFQLKRGELVLHRRRKKGFSFSHEEVARGTEWPLRYFTSIE